MRTRGKATLRSQKRKAPSEASLPPSRKVRRAENGEPQNVAVDESDDLKSSTLSINSLTAVTCNVYHVSPLEVSDRSQDLNKFSRELENSLRENGSILVNSGGSVSIQANTFFLPGVKQSTHDSDCLMIEIFKEVIDDIDEVGERVERILIFRCMFFSCESSGRSLRFTRIHANPSTPKNLPVCLWHGKSSAWNTIRPIFEDKLKCTFSPVFFSTVHLQIFTGLWLYQQVKRGLMEKHHNEVRIEYQFVIPRMSQAELPVGVAILNFTKWKTELSNLEARLEDNLALRRELIRLWDDVLDAYTSVDKVSLARTHFLKVATNTCVVTSKARIKLRKESKLEEILPILRQLTRIVELR